MYTATITSKSIQRAAKRVVVIVEFTNGTDTFSEPFEFGFNFTELELKSRIKDYITKLESVQTNIETIAPNGVVDLSTVVDYVPTAAEIAKDEWFKDFYRLQGVQKLIDLGILTGTEPKVVQLRDGLKTGFKAAYIADLV